jgi:hypothetical protein
MRKLKESASKGSADAPQGSGRYRPDAGRYRCQLSYFVAEGRRLAAV